MWKRIISTAFVFILLSNTTYAEELVVIVNEVYDGDTFYINIDSVPDILGKRLGVRVEGIDSPEIRSTDLNKRRLAIQAREIAVTKLLNKRVKLTNIKRDKFFRLRAKVEILDSGENFGQFMLDIRCAKEYHGEKRK